MEVGEDDISGQGKEGFVKLVQISRFSRDMKFHDRRTLLMFHKVKYRPFPRWTQEKLWIFWIGTWANNILVKEDEMEYNFFPKSD